MAPGRTHLAGFAAGSRRDFGAVRAALDTPWTASHGDGQIDRLKKSKRAVYGRAGLQHPRARVLHAT